MICYVFCLMRIASARAWRARAMRAGKRHAYLDNLPDPTFCPAGGPFNLLIYILLIYIMNHSW